MRLARRDGGRRRRWPGWRKLNRGAGGHPGGVRRGCGEALVVRADGLAVDAGNALDLALAGAGVQQGPDGRLQVRLQDVHSVASLADAEGGESNVLPGGLAARRQTVAKVGEFTWPSVEEFGWPPGAGVAKLPVYGSKGHDSGVADDH